MTSVLQPWLEKLTWKEQSALLTAIRGNDDFYNTNVRTLVRWLRRQTLYDADINGTFIKHGDLPEPTELKKDLEYMRLHFVSHLMHGLQIIGYKHPIIGISKTGYDYYKSICHTLHCEMESEEDMNERLKDNREKI